MQKGWFSMQRNVIRSPTSKWLIVQLCCLLELIRKSWDVCFVSLKIKHALISKSKARTCFKKLDSICYRSVQVGRDVPRQFRLGGIHKKVTNYILDQLFFHTKLIQQYIIEGQCSRSDLQWNILLNKWMKYRLKFGQSSQCMLKSRLHDQLSWSFIDIGGVRLHSPSRHSPAIKYTIGRIGETHENTTIATQHNEEL